MSQNTIIKGKTNKVRMVYTTDISTATEIILIIGSETLSTITDSTKLYVEGTTVLALDIGTTTALDEGNYYPNVSADGELITGDCNPTLDGFIVVC